MKKPVGLRIVAMIFTYLLLAALIVLFFVSHGQLLDVAGTWTYIIPMVLAAILVSIPRGMPSNTGIPSKKRPATPASRHSGEHSARDAGVAGRFLLGHGGDAFVLQLGFGTGVWAGAGQPWLAGSCGLAARLSLSGQ